MPKLKLVDLIHASLFTALNYCYAVSIPLIQFEMIQTTSPSRSHQHSGFLFVRD